MKISKKTVPYSVRKCKWDKESEGWLFNWGEEIPDEWVKFSIKHEYPVESINDAYEKDPAKFKLDEDVMDEILDED
jgi:hypothetical protein